MSACFCISMFLNYFTICSLIISVLQVFLPFNGYLPSFHLLIDLTCEICVCLQSTFFCECEDGYTGIFCEEFDACHRRPCHNNGTCTDVRQGGEGRNFTCTCPPGAWTCLYTATVYAHVEDESQPDCVVLVGLLRSA